MRNFFHDEKIRLFICSDNLMQKVSKNVSSIDKQPGCQLCQEGGGFSEIRLLPGPLAVPVPDLNGCYIENLQVHFDIGNGGRKPNQKSLLVFKS